MVLGFPGSPVLSCDNGWDNGLQDGYYHITMNLWWGNNANAYRLYENDKLIDTQSLVPNTPQAQTAITAINEKPNGTYLYRCELINDYGVTSSSTITVNVTQATPEAPTLSSDNWDEDGNYTVSMNMWWGTNADKCRLYENGTLVGEILLNENTPNAQCAAWTFSNKESGTYTYTCELKNYAGTTSSSNLTVTVR